MARRSERTRSLRRRESATGRADAKRPLRRGRTTLAASGTRSVPSSFSSAEHAARARAVVVKQGMPRASAVWRSGRVRAISSSPSAVTAATAIAPSRSAVSAASAESTSDGTREAGQRGGRLLVRGDREAECAEPACDSSTTTPRSDFDTERNASAVSPARGAWSTHWRRGTFGITWSTRFAAIALIVRARHDGQNPRPLYANATSREARARF